MDNNLKKLLEEEIESELQNISTYPTGSKEKTAAINDVIKLYELKLEETKNEIGFNELQEKRINESRDEQFKKSQFKEEIKYRRFRTGLDIAGLILPLLFYAHWMRKGLKFEETGTFTSATFKGLLNRFRPTNKN